MSLKTEAIKRFLTAARSLANQGLSREAIMQFAKNEFGEITELFQKQIDNIFRRPASGIEKIKIKDPDFDDTVVKMQFDEEGIPFNPKDPLKDYSKKPSKGLSDKDFRSEKTSFRLNIAKNSPEFNQDLAKKIINREIYTDLSDSQRKEFLDDLDFVLKNPRGDYYTGGMVDVEPNLSDIGHGSDALMARTRLMSPGGQATTSTGLNYLLAEDNDNIRIPFSKGKIADAARRKFLRLAGTGIGGLAALKAGLINLAKDAAPKVEMVKETVSQTPDYFFDLVSKIKMFGKEGTPISERMNVTNYKNFELTEDIATGDMRITKQAGDPDGPGYREEVMEYSKGGNPMEEGGQTIERYEEATLFPDIDGKMKDIEDGIEPDSIKEIMEEIKEIKKAEGGRIGYSKGKAVLSLVEILKDPKKIREAIDNIFKTGDYKMDAEMAAESLVELNPQAFGGKLYDDLDDKTRMQVYGAVIDDVMKDFGKKIKETKTDTYKFLEKVFGKENMSEMPNRDPLMYEGLKEVVPMFRQKDKARKKQELIMYMQKYLPHMDDAEIEAFIKGSDGTEGLRGQLIRLGSGRDYAEKIEMMKNLQRNRALRDLEVTEEMKRKPNASGGIAKLLGE